jgi:purine-binding chemotaxis protein CheW
MSEKVIDQIPVLTFLIGDKQYALFIDYVVEVAAMVQYSHVADSTPYLLGMVNRHGQVMPLIDLRTVFELDTPIIDTNILFIVARQDDILVGLVVDAVNQVEYIYESDLRVAPGGGRWIEQVASYHDDLLQIVNLPAVVTHLLPETLTAQQEIEDKF